MSAATVIFLVLAVACWGGGAFFDKLTLNRIGATDAFILRLGLLGLFAVPFVLWRWHPTRDAVAISGKLPVILVATSIVVTMSGVYFYLRAMSGAEASRIVPMSSTYPLVAFLLALIFLGEKFTWAKLAGTVLVCAGVGVLAL